MPAADIQESPGLEATQDAQGAQRKRLLQRIAGLVGNRGARVVMRVWTACQSTGGNSATAASAAVRRLASGSPKKMRTALPLSASLNFATTSAAVAHASALLSPKHAWITWAVSALSRASRTMESRELARLPALAA